MINNHETKSKKLHKKVKHIITDLQNINEKLNKLKKEHNLKYKNHEKKK